LTNSNISAILKIIKFFISPAVKKGALLMNCLTSSEYSKIHEITGRLANMPSSALRLQAILQFSQIVDILALGDTGREDSIRQFNMIDELENELDEYREREEQAQTPSAASEPSVGGSSLFY